MPKEQPKRSILPDFLEELAHLQEAESILDALWCEIGPYDNRFSSEVVNRLRRHFKFDDSE